MTRLLTVIAAISVGLLVTAGTAGASKDRTKTKKFNAYAVVDSATNVDNAPAGDSQGDIITFTQALYTDSTKTKQIGTDEVYCVRTIVDTSRVCTGIIHIKGGELMVTGRESLERHSLAITGGTGKWRNARGEIVLVPDTIVADNMAFKITVR